MVDKAEYLFHAAGHTVVGGHLESPLFSFLKTLFLCIEQLLFPRQIINQAIKGPAGHH